MTEATEGVSHYPPGLLDLGYPLEEDGGETLMVRPLRIEFGGELARYIVLNPVRAGIVADPKDWPWSSWRGTVGLEETLDLATRRWQVSRDSRAVGRKPNPKTDCLAAGFGAW